MTEWKGSIVHIDRRGTRSADPATRYVARPGMVDLALHMADGLDIRTGVRIEKATPEGAGTRGDTATREGTANGWRLHDADGRSCGSFDGLVLAVPAPQAVPLLSAVPDLRAVVAGVEMEPCWAGMMVFASPPPLPFDAAFLEDAALSWVARDASKPDRPAHEAWVVHATPAWTRAHWDMDREAVEAELERVLSSRFGPLPDVTFSRAHRWGYALASGAPVGILHDTRHRIGVCGDWCVGGRVEGALSSGIQIAERMLA